MTIRIPNKGRFSQPNKGEISGNLYRTTNIDLYSNQGRLRVSPRLIVNTKDNDGGVSQMGIPGAFGYLNNLYYAMCGIGNYNNSGTGRIFYTNSGGSTDNPSATFINEATSGTPQDVNADTSDMVAWSNGNYTSGGTRLGPSLFVSTFSASTTQIKQLYTGSHWDTQWFTSTVSGSFREQLGGKNMCVGFNNNLYILDADRIIYVPHTTYQTNINAVLTSSGAANTQTGTIDFVGQYRPIWMRSSSKYLWVGLIADYQFTSGATRGFVGQWDATGTSLNAIYDIEAPYVMSCCILKDVPHIIDAYGRLKKFDGTGFVEIARFPVASQIVDANTTAIAQTNQRWVHHRGMDVVGGKINIAVNNFIGGVYIEDMPSGIWELNDDDPVHPFLYHKSSPCADTTDFGQQMILNAGAVYGTKRTTASYLAGFSYYTDSGSTARNAIFYDDVLHTTARRGVMVTPWLDSTQIEDTFQRIHYRYRPLVSGSKIEAKSRTQKSAHLPFTASVTWSATNLFSSTDANFQYASAGDEVEVMMGLGASTTAHISGTPVLTTGTYTVLLDDFIGASSGSAKVKVNNFRKLGELSQLIPTDQSVSPNRQDTMIQIKTEFRDEGGFELNDITAITPPHKLAT